MWDQDELISKPAERDLWWQFVEELQMIMMPVKNMNRRARNQMSHHLPPSPWIWVADRLIQHCSPTPLPKQWPTVVHRGVSKNQGSRKREKIILLSPSVVAKGTQSACLCCDWIIIFLLIHVVSFLHWVCSERQGSLYHPAAQDKSHERFPTEPQRANEGERFSPNARWCHCHGVRRPTAHSTWTDRKENRHLFWHVSPVSPHLFPQHFQQHESNGTKK